MMEADDIRIYPLSELAPGEGGESFIRALKRRIEALKQRQQTLEALEIIRFWEGKKPDDNLQTVKTKIAENEELLRKAENKENEV
jgi:hypothetical protein